MNNIIGRIEEIVADQKSLLKRYTTEKYSYCKYNNRCDAIRHDADDERGCLCG